MTTRVLVVDDSALARESLVRAIGSEKGFEVVGTAARASDALRLVERLRPDIVTMDVYLGSDDGIELSTQIMELRATPILIVTGDQRDPSLPFRAIRAGALEVLPKLPAQTHASYLYERQRLLRALAALARVPMVTRHLRANPEARGAAGEAAAVLSAPRGKTRLVVIGASTGGPAVLQEILVTPHIRVPIAIVQHIADGFVEMLAEWLASTTGRRVCICKQDMAIEPATIFFAPSGAHLVITSAGTLAPREAPPRNHQKPSIDVLFESAASVLGPMAVGLLLSGMGSDGASGLSRLKAAGAYTMVQAPATCAVDSMPVTAIELGAACAVNTPAEIAAKLGSLELF